MASATDDDDWAGDRWDDLADLMDLIDRLAPDDLAADLLVGLPPAAPTPLHEGAPSPYAVLSPPAE